MGKGKSEEPKVLETAREAEGETSLETELEADGEGESLVSEDGEKKAPIQDVRDLQGDPVGPGDSALLSADSEVDDSDEYLALRSDSDSDEEEGEEDGLALEDEFQEGEEDSASEEPLDERTRALDRLLLKNLVQRAISAGDKLRSQLQGTILLWVQDMNRGYRYDGGQIDLKAKVSSKTDDTDCVIELSEDNLRRIARGKLNPQVAMLSDKVYVRGQLGLAVYFFNLLVPRARD